MQTNCSGSNSHGTLIRKYVFPYQLTTRRGEERSARADVAEAKANYDAGAQRDRLAAGARSGA
jgi:hypothetical protein